jgi:transposase
MLTKGEEYTDQGQDYYEERYRQRVLRQLSQRAEKMGMKLVATEQPAYNQLLERCFLRGVS